MSWDEEMELAKSIFFKIDFGQSFENVILEEMPFNGAIAEDIIFVINDIETSGRGRDFSYYDNNFLFHRTQCPGKHLTAYDLEQIVKSAKKDISFEEALEKYPSNNSAQKVWKRFKKRMKHFSAW